MPSLGELFGQSTPTTQGAASAGDGTASSEAELLALLAGLEPLRGDERRLPYLDPGIVEGWPAVEVDLATWKQAADLLVVGEVAAVDPVRDYGLEEGGSFRAEALRPAEECGALQGGLVVTLTNVLPLAGSSPADLEIRIGYSPQGVFRRGCRAQRTDSGIQWESEDCGIFPGMLIGGALYHVTPYRLFSLETEAMQPAFSVDSEGRIVFQEMSPSYWTWSPPISTLEGRRLVDVAELLHHVASPPLDRAENPLRKSLLMDAPADEPPERRHQWFARCVSNVPLECATATDCGEGFACDRGRCRAE